MYQKLIAFGILIQFSVTGYSQDNQLTTTNQIGSKAKKDEGFASIYILRKYDEFTNNYFGFLIDDSFGLYAKVRSGQVYRVNTHALGTRKLFFATSAGVSEQWATLESGKSYYFELIVNSSGEGQFHLQFLESDSSKVYSFLEGSKNKIRDCYSRLPNTQMEFLSSFTLNDSINWFYNSEKSFSIIMPQFTDALSRGELPALSYYNPHDSKTYSEGLHLRKMKKTKFKSKSEFDTYVIEKMTKSLDGIFLFSKEKVDFLKVLSNDVLPFSLYSSLTYIESKDYDAVNKGKHQYLLCKAIIVPFVINQSDGNQYLYYFIHSERGIESEMSTQEELLEKFDPILQSFEIVNKPSKFVIFE